MRIGIYDPYLDDGGGGEKYMMSIASYLSQKNTVTVFWDNKKDLQFIAERFNLNLSHVQLVPNIFTPQVSLLSRLKATAFYDAIIFLSDGSIPVSFSKKLFLHIQQPLPNTHYGLFTKFKLKRVTNIFCNSFFSKSFVDKQLIVDSVVIYPPVQIQAKEVKKENSILHVGRFRVANVGVADYKKQSIMIDVFKKMVDNGLKKWKFVLAVGLREKDTREFEKLKASAKGYPIEFYVNKSNNQLWELYSQAKIYWHASGFGENLAMHPEYAEHFGISTVEAMGAGAVPVVIRAGGQPEIVTEGVTGMLWDTLDQLQTKTKFLIENEKLLHKLSEQAKKRAQDFSPEKFQEKLDAMIG